MCALLKTVGPIRSYVAGAADHNTELVWGTHYTTEFYEFYTGLFTSADYCSPSLSPKKMSYSWR